MSTIGSYGIIIPDAADESSVEWNPKQRLNWQQVDGHNHDGVNSASIAGVILTKANATLLAAGWVLVADGIYRQSVDLDAILAGSLYNNTIITFFEVGGDKLELETHKTAASVCDVYCNDNSLDVLVVIA